MGVVLPRLLPMQPYLREMVWGGRRLERLFAKELPPEKCIGEAFELSAYKAHESCVAAGPLAGRDLRGLLAEYRQALVGAAVWERYGAAFPLLIKLLDPQQDLSIQVHPDDVYAQRNSLGPFGKMEAWFILDATDGRIAYGLKPGTEPQDLVQALAADSVEEVVNFCSVQRGDVVFVPPGTVHALCRGVIIYEVQQASDLTFRLFDYNRLGLDGKPRQLHIEQSLEVIDFAAKPLKPVPWWQLPGVGQAGGMLVDTPYFQLQLQRLDSARAFCSVPVFQALTLIDGKAMICSEQEQYPMGIGSTVLITADSTFEVVPQEDKPCEYLLAVAVA